MKKNELRQNLKKSIEDVFHNFDVSPNEAKALKQMKEDAREFQAERDIVHELTSKMDTLIKKGDKKDFKRLQSPWSNGSGKTQKN